MEDNAVASTLLQLSASSSSLSVDTSAPLLNPMDSSISIVELAPDQLSPNSTSESESGMQATNLVSPDKSAKNDNSSSLDDALNDVSDDVENTNKEESENFDPNQIIQEILVHETGDKHTTARLKYQSEKAKVIGEKIQVPYGNSVLEWEVIGDVKESDYPWPKERHKQVGVCGFDFFKFEVLKRKYGRINLLRLIIHLWPGDWEEQLKEVNDRLSEEGQNKKRLDLFPSMSSGFSSASYWLHVSKERKICGKQIVL